MQEGFKIFKILYGLGLLVLFIITAMLLQYYNFILVGFCRIKLVLSCVLSVKNSIAIVSCQSTTIKY